MTRVLTVILSMYAFALVLLLVDRFLVLRGVVKAVNRFVGWSVGAFATGLVFVLMQALLFPSENQTARNTRALRMLTDSVAALTARVDSLATRLP